MTATTKDAGETVARKALHLSPTNMQDASHFRTRWMAITPAGTSVEDVCRPEFWLHVASRLKRMDIIEVLPEDEVWLAELLVIRSGVGAVMVKVLRHDMIDEAGGEPSELSSVVEWGGPVHKYRVIRKADRHVISHGFADKATALADQAQYERALAA